MGLCVGARWLGGWSWIEVWLLAAALATASQGVFTVATSRALFEREVPARSVLRRFATSLPRYLLALLISRAILAVSAVTVLLLPLAWARVAYIHETVLLEGGGAVAASTRAWRMGQARAVEVSLLLGGLGLVLVVGTLAAELIGHGLVEFVLQLGRPLGSLFEDGGSLYALLGFHLAIPYVAVARFLGYIDERTRGDGWDIQLRFQALAAARDDAETREASP